MELKDRMAIINDKAKRINDEKRIKEEKIDIERKELLNKISSLEERIHDLITLVNECVKNGINLPANTENMVMELDIEVIISMLTAFIIMLDLWGVKKKCVIILEYIMADFVEHGIFIRMEKKYS